MHMKARRKSLAFCVCAQGYYPDFPDTSIKPIMGPGGVPWQTRGMIRELTNACYTASEMSDGKTGSVGASGRSCCNLLGMTETGRQGTEQR